MKEMTEASEKVYRPRFRFISVILSGPLVFVVLWRVLKGSLAGMLPIALVLIAGNILIVAVHFLLGRYFSVILSDDEIKGYHPSPWSVCLIRPISMARERVDKERSRRRSSFDKFNGTWNIWATDGRRIVVNEHVLGKEQMSSLFSELGIKRVGDA